MTRIFLSILLFSLSAQASFIATAGGGTPGGSTGQIQYNNSGAFGGLSSPTTTEIAYVGGVTSAIQTQLNAKVGALAAVGSSPSANGASISGSTLTLQPADATNPGLLTAGAQTIAGAKTITGFTIFNQGGTSTAVRVQSSGSTSFDLNQFGSTDSNYPSMSAISGGDFGGSLIVETKGGGHGAGLASGWSDGSINATAWTVQGRSYSNTGGTTTVNASTSISGSGSKFWQEWGVMDLASVSSAATTYAHITAIASNTAMTSALALGNGTSQTLNKKQALTVLLDSSRNVKFFVDHLGNTSMGYGALATDAVDGFPYIPSCPGVPTGSPRVISGMKPLVIDSAAHKMYFYDNSAWNILN